MDIPPAALPPVAVEFQVEPNYAGWTLSAYVGEKLRRLDLDRMHRMLLGPALVHAEAIPLGPETIVWPGLRFGLRKRSIGDEGEPPVIPVVHEDDALLVLDKPAGLALHPTARYYLSTLTRALSTRHLNAAGQKPDPAHRIDRETSGLVACGRTPAHSKELKAAFAGRRVGKRYLAIVEGDPPMDVFDIDLPLALGTNRIRIKMRVDAGGYPSSTACRVEQRYRDAAGRPLALLRCTPRTGRQHQLRAHLSAVGLPIVGDKLYGPDEGIFLRLAESGLGPAPVGQFDALLSPAECAALRLTRHALHAEELTLPHPTTGERLRLRAPLPADLAALLASLAPVGPPLGRL